MSAEISVKGARIAAVIVLLFGLVLVGFGQGLIRGASDDKAVAQSLRADGGTGVVDDARVAVTRGEDGEWRASKIELTFTGADGSAHTLTTQHFDKFSPPMDSVAGWQSDFPNKGDFLGQEVRYILGDNPAVELVTELPALAGASWGFVSYLGLALAVLGVAALIGGTVALMRNRQPGRRDMAG